MVRQTDKPGGLETRANIGLLSVNQQLYVVQQTLLSALAADGPFRINHKIKTVKAEGVEEDEE